MSEEYEPNLNRESAGRAVGLAVGIVRNKQVINNKYNLPWP